MYQPDVFLSNRSLKPYADAGTICCLDGENGLEMLDEYGLVPDELVEKKYRTMLESSAERYPS